MARKGKIACVYVKPESAEVWAVFLAQLKIIIFITSGQNASGEALKLIMVFHLSSMAFFVFLQ